MRGSLLRESDEAPRTRMRDPDPTCPELPMTLTPAARPVSSSWKERTGCVATMSAALTVVTTLPIAFFSAFPAGPVTTTWLSSSARSTMPMRSSTSPTRARRVAAWKPMRRIDSVTLSPESPPMRKRPLASVVVPVAVPATKTCVPGTGAPLAALTTTPPTVPCCAASGAASAARSVNEASVFLARRRASPVTGAGAGARLWRDRRRVGIRESVGMVEIALRLPKTPRGDGNARAAGMGRTHR